MKNNNNNLDTQNLTIDSRSHTFNVGIARDHSVDMALWIGHLAFWSEKNLANNRNIHDGLVWSYDSAEALTDYFPYFTKRQIERLINHSIKAGLVVKGNYNRTTWDRTSWYALTPKAYGYFPHLMSKKYMDRMRLSISPNGNMDLTVWQNGFHQTVTAIPSTIPDTDPQCVGNTSETHTTDNKKNKPSLKEYIEETAFNNEEIREIFNSKFSRFECDYTNLFIECRTHYESKGEWLTMKKWKLWVEREKVSHYKKRTSPIVHEFKFTEEELDLVQQYKAAYQYSDIYPERLDQLMPNKSMQLRALEIIEKMNQDSAND